MNEAPALRAHGVIALIVAGDGRALPWRAGITELRPEAEPLEVLVRRQAGHLQKRGINVK